MPIEVIQADECHRAIINRLIRGSRIGNGIHGSIQQYWVVRRNNEIVACAGYDFHGPVVSILTHLVVRQDLRHRGIGAALVRHWMNHSRKNGRFYLALCSMYYRFNFYKRRGFITCPRKDLPDVISDYWQFTAKRYMKSAVMWRIFMRHHPLPADPLLNV